MHIDVEFTTDLKRTMRASRRLRRRVRYSCWAVGVSFLLLAVLVGATGGSVTLLTTLVVLGLIVLVEVDFLLWLSIRRNQNALVQKVDVTLTDEIIRRKTATVTAEFEWKMVSRIIDERDFWVFIIDKLNTVTLFKAFLAPEQRGELEGFLAKRSGPR